MVWTEDWVSGVYVMQNTGENRRMDKVLHYT